MDSLLDLVSLSSLSALLQVVMVDLVLAGDNAIVVGMVAAGLPRDQRARVIVIGIAAATLMRVGFAVVTSQLLQIIGLTLAGGILLLWVCWKLWRELREQRGEDAGADALADAAQSNGGAGAAVAAEAPRKTFRQAVVQIVIADVSMSLDNVLAVAGVAREHTWVLIIGLVLSVAFMGAAATLIAGLLKRFHWIAYVGLAIIFYVALHMIWEGSVAVMEAAEVAGVL
jgi:YjbE family integral membrane protein